MELKQVRRKFSKLEQVLRLAIGFGYSLYGMEACVATLKSHDTMAQSAMESGLALVDLSSTHHSDTPPP